MTAPLNTQQPILNKLTQIYGPEATPSIYKQLLDMLPDNDRPPIRKQLAVSQKDVVLICYGDHVWRDDEKPLKTLQDVLMQSVHPIINSVHLLPFFPYSSDDGFSVIDYLSVDPDLGDWTDIQQLSGDFRLMFDAVVNHVSAKSDWFQQFKQGTAPYTEYFLSVPPDTDLSSVVRPRALPLLTAVDTNRGTQHVWTTFSDDQIDLNYSNPAVFLEVVRVLLAYIERGAQFIRLDAIAFIWKEAGTPSIHLPQTHLIVQLFRHIVDLAAPEVVLITETNVPHQENISYFGDGTNEAQMVYNFALPPLVLHTLHAQNATALTRWAQSLEETGKLATYFNFTASHDGIGLRPAEGLIRNSDIESLVERVEANGGRVSYRTTANGKQSAYELNITYFDALNSADLIQGDVEQAIGRFIVSQAIALALRGVPGIYFNSLYGSRNWQEGVEQTGRARSINRRKFNADDFLKELRKETSLRHQIFTAYIQLLRARRDDPAFHPLGGQTVLDLGSEIFGVERTSPDGNSYVVALHNVTDGVVKLDLDVEAREWYDIVSGETYTLLGDANSLEVILAPYQVAWLKAN